MKLRLPIQILSGEGRILGEDQIYYIVYPCMCVCVYIYVCVCVCVCVYQQLKNSMESGGE